MGKIITTGVFFLYFSSLWGQSWIQGLSFVAPPQPISPQATKKVQEVGAEYIAVIPYGFCRPGEANLWYDMPGQWWGERLEGCRSTIQQAHQDGLQVMLKPQVYVPGGWIGHVSFEDDEEWKAWEQSYTDYIMACLEIAITEDVSMFCLGTEVKTSVKERPHFWISLIEEIRESYCGQLTYSANWDSYADVPFWNDLDLIGISAYFPLKNTNTPSVSSLEKAWQPIALELKNFSASTGRPVLFSEYGYLSVDGAAGKNWEKEKKIHHLEVNETAQKNALEALWRVFCKEKFWAGGFLWKWFPDGQGHEGYFDKDYTPQGKEAEEVLKYWYSQP